MVLQGVIQLWHVAQWVSGAPPHHTLPAFLNLNGTFFPVILGDNLFQDFRIFFAGYFLIICAWVCELLSGVIMSLGRFDPPPVGKSQIRKLLDENWKSTHLDFLMPLSNIIPNSKYNTRFQYIINHESQGPDLRNFKKFTRRQRI